jgi:predicted nuclease of restriction endonuclease-like (RecB) superfamily
MDMRRKSGKQLQAGERNEGHGGIAGYGALLTDLKERIRTAQVRAGLAVNRELIQLYWDVGRAIVGKQEEEGWGTAVIDRLAEDLGREFPNLTGFSRTNVYRMRLFYMSYRCVKIVPHAVGQFPAEGFSKATRGEIDPCMSKFPIVPQPVGQLEPKAPPEPMASLPWGHNVTLIESVKEADERVWYARKAVEHGWSRAVMEHWIGSDLCHRQGKAVTNFQATMPAAQSELAQQILKDPYNFDFLTLREKALEKELEEGLLEKITRFLLELGEGFAFVGRQVRLEVDGESTEHKGN